MRISDWSADVCSSDLFHQGGSAGAADITQGLPRVTELFEARTPKGASPIAAAAGRTEIEDSDKQRRIDRKSVALGKSVSVRVDRGGRRNIKTKNDSKQYISDNIYLITEQTTTT